MTLGEIALWREIKGKNLDDYIINLIKKEVNLTKNQPIKDGCGNQLVLFYGVENRLNPPWKIKNATG